MNPIPTIASLPRKTGDHRVIRARAAAQCVNFVIAVLVELFGADLTGANNQGHPAEFPGRGDVMLSSDYSCQNLSWGRILDANCADAAAPDATRFVPESIVLIPLTPPPAFLVFRRFTVHSETFIQRLRGVHEQSLVVASPSGGHGSRTQVTNLTTDPNELVRKYLVAAGMLDFGGTNRSYAPQVFFDPEHDSLLIGATAADLEIIEEVLQPVPQVQFTLRLFEAKVEAIKMAEPSVPNHGRGSRPAERLFETVRVLSATAAHEAITARAPAARHISTSEGIIPGGAQTQILKLGSQQALASTAGVTTNGSAVPIRVTIEMLANLQPDGGVTASFVFDSFQAVAWPSDRALSSAATLASASAPPTPTAARYRRRQTFKTVAIPSGHSVLVALDADESGNQPSAKSPLGLKLLITPVIVAPVKNRSH